MPMASDLYFSPKHRIFKILLIILPLLQWIILGDFALFVTFPENREEVAVIKVNSTATTLFAILYLYGLLWVFFSDQLPFCRLNARAYGHGPRIYATLTQAEITPCQCLGVRWGSKCSVTVEYEDYTETSRYIQIRKTFKTESSVMTSRQLATIRAAEVGEYIEMAIVKGNPFSAFPIQGVVALQKKLEPLKNTSSTIFALATALVLFYSYHAFLKEPRACEILWVSFMLIYCVSVVPLMCKNRKWKDHMLHGGEEVSSLSLLERKGHSNTCCLMMFEV